MGRLANAACVHCLVLLPLTCSFYGFATDIVFCRTWVPVEAKKFYNPVSSLLGPLRAPDSEDGAGAAKLGWVAMKSTGQLRKERALPVPSNPNSAYKVCGTAWGYTPFGRWRIVWNRSGCRVW